MNLRKTSIFVLCGLLSYDSMASLPTVRTSSIRLGQATPSTSATNTSRVTISKLPGRGQTGTSKIPSAGKPNTGTSNATLKEEFQELRQVISEQLNEQRDEIESLRATIAEKDKVIANLESSLEDYEEIKATVKNMPTTIRNEIDSRRLATVDSLNTVQQQVQQNAAKFNDYATKSQVENLELGTDVDEVKQIITTQLAANKVVTESDLNDVSAEVAAVRTSVQNEAQARTRAIADLESSVDSEVNAVRTLAQSNSEKFANYTTKEQFENLEVGTDEAAVREIVTAQLNAKNYATESEVNAVRTMAQSNTEKFANYATKGQLDSAIADATGATDEKLAQYVKTQTISQTLLDYAPKSALDNYAKTSDLAEVNTRVDGLSQDMAGTLLQDKVFMDGVLAAAGENVEELIDTVDTLDGKIKVIEGANYLKTADLRQAVTELDLPTGTDENRVKEIITAHLDENNVVTTDDLSDYATIDAVGKVEHNLLTGWNEELANRFKDVVTKEELRDNTVEITEVIDGKIGNIGEELIANPDFTGEMAELINADFAKVPVDIADLKTRIGTLEGSDFLKPGDLRDYAKIVDVPSIDGLVKVGDFNDRISELDGKFVLNTEFTSKVGEFVDGKFVLLDDLNDHVLDITNPKFVAVGALDNYATIGLVDGKFKNISDTIADDLIGNTGFTGQIVGMLDENLKTLPSVVDGLSSRVGSLESSGKNYALKTDLNALDTKFVWNTDIDNKIGEFVNGRFVLKSDLEDNVLDITNPKFVAVGSLGNYALKTDLNALDNKFVLNTEFSSKVGEFVDGKFVLKTDLEDNVLDITNPKFVAVGSLGDYALKTDLTNLDNKFVLNTEFSSKVGEFVDGKFVLLDDLNDHVLDITNPKFVAVGALDNYATIGLVDGKFKNISDTIADDLIGNTDFTGQIVGMLDENLKTLPSVVDGLSSRVGSLESSGKNYALKTDLNALDNKFVLNTEFTSKVGEFVDGKFVLADDLNDHVLDITNSKFIAVGELDNLAKVGDVNDRFSAIDTTIAGLDNKFVLDSALSAKVGEFVDGKFVLKTDLEDNVLDITNPKFVAAGSLGDYALKTDLTNLDNKYVLNTDFNNKVGNFVNGKFVPEEGFELKVAGLPTVVGLIDNVNSFPQTLITVKDEAKNEALAAMDSDLADKIAALPSIRDLQNKVYTDLPTSLQLMKKEAKEETLAEIDADFVKYTVLEKDYTKKSDAVTADNFVNVLEAKWANSQPGVDTAEQIADWMRREEELNSNIHSILDEHLPNAITETLAAVDSKGYLKPDNLGAAAADAGLLKVADLPTKVADAGFLTASNLGNAAANAGLALKSELPDTSTFALKTDIPTNFLTAGNAYTALNATWGASQIEGLIKKSTVFNSLPAAVQTNKTNIANETTARTNAISGLSSVYAPKSLETTVSTMNTGLSNLGSSLNTLGAQVETNATNIAANVDALNTTNSTVNTLRNGLSNTMDRVNAFTSCDGAQQCYSSDLSISGTVTLPSLPSAGGDFTWTPTNP